jgi:hypothetical protein
VLAQNRLAVNGSGSRRPQPRRHWHDGVPVQRPAGFGQHPKWIGSQRRRFLHPARPSPRPIVTTARLVFATEQNIAIGTATKVALVVFDSTRARRS